MRWLADIERILLDFSSNRVLGVFYSGWICALLLGQFGGHGRCVECWESLGVHGEQSSDFAELNAGCADLIYLDPPFGSCRDYAGKMDSVGGKHPVLARALARIESLCPKLVDFLELVPSRHSRSHQNYLVYVGVRLLDLHRILDFRGSLYLYCDAAAAHYLKCVLDCILGRNNFREECVGHWTAAGRAVGRMFCFYVLN